MSEYKITIGCEIHVQLKTKTKMFSSSANSSYDIPNTNITEIDLAIPGTLPSPNKKAIELAILFAKALNMSIDTNLCFDRKNYFYQDLPKSYQITQFYNPIGSNGKIQISNKIIEIERIHLEEDTAKQEQIDNYLYMDYNRAGIPLIEIVSRPQINSEDECYEYLTELKKILTFLEISDGKMEDGSLRVDLNISISNTEKMGTKVEIKNINSFNNVKKAIKYEYERQKELLDNDKEVKQETRRWDDGSQSTIFMREKGDSVDYNYITEANICPIDISALEQEIVLKDNLLPINIKNKLLPFLPISLIETLLNDYELYKLFDKINNEVDDLKLVGTWVSVELVGLLNSKNKKINSLNEIFISKFIILLIAIKQRRINNKQAKEIFEILSNDENIDIRAIINMNESSQINDDSEIKEILKKYIESNMETVKLYPTRPERVEKFLIGMVMKETKGQANPILTKKIFDDLIKEYISL